MLIIENLQPGYSLFIHFYFQTTPLVKKKKLLRSDRFSIHFCQGGHRDIDKL